MVKLCPSNSVMLFGTALCLQEQVCAVLCVCVCLWCVCECECVQVSTVRVAVCNKPP